MIIYLSDKRRQAAEVVAMLQHLVPGVSMLLVGAAKLADESERLMATAEVALGLIVLGAFVREIRHARKHHGSHSTIGWFDIAAGVVLLYEAFHGAHHKPGYLRPQFFSAMVTFGLGLFHGRLSRFKDRRRYLKLDENGIELVRPFRKVALVWTDVRSVDVTGAKAVIHLHGGRHHSFRLHLLNNHDEVRKSLADHARAAGVALEKVS